MTEDKIYSLTGIRHPEFRVPLVLKARDYRAETAEFLRYRQHEIFPEEMLWPGCETDLRQHMAQMFELRPFEAAKMAADGTIREYMRKKLLLADRLRTAGMDANQGSVEAGLLASREVMVNVEKLPPEAFWGQQLARAELLLADIQNLPPEIPPETFLSMAKNGIRTQKGLRKAPAAELAAGILLSSWVRREALPAFLSDREREGIYLLANTLMQESVRRASELMISPWENLGLQMRAFLEQRLRDIVTGQEISKTWHLPSLLSMSQLMEVLTGLGA